MKTANVKSVQPSGNFKELFMFEVEFDNGDTGNIYKKSINPGLELGQSVTYVINDKGTIKIQRDIPNNYVKNNEEDKMTKQEWADRDERKELVYARKTALDCATAYCDADKCSPEKILETANMFCTWLISGQIKSNLHDKIPF